MFDVQEIADMVKGRVRGDGSLRIDRVRPVTDAAGDGLAILFSQGDAIVAETARYQALIGPPGTFCPGAQAIIEVEKLEVTALNRFLRQFKARKYRLFDQGNTTTIPDVYIGKHCTIGQGCHFMPGVRIMNGVTIGNNVGIHVNTVIKEGTVIGDNVVIDSNTSIGNFSFEYMAGRNTKYDRLESVGRVLIGDEVEIGSNCSIDRGTFGDTRIGTGTKIDNQVQIGHDVIIGAHCLIVSQVGISGHAVIGDEVILHGQVGIAGHVTIGARSVVQAKSGVSRSCPEDSTLFGYPARDRHDALKALARLNAMTRKH